MRRSGRRPSRSAPSSAASSRSSAGGVGREHVDALLPDLRLQLRGRAGGDLAAVVDQHDVVGQRVGLFEVLRRQQQRHAFGDELADRRPHDLAAAWVEAGRRLVEHEQLRLVDQARGEIDAAALAAGEVLHEPVAELLDVEALDQLLGDTSSGAAAVAAQARHQHQVLASP